MHELLGSPLPGFPRDVVTSQLAETFDCNASWVWMDADGRAGFEVHRPIPGWPTPDEVAWYSTEGMARHPLIRWYAATGDPRPLTVGRVPDGVRVPGHDHELREHLGAVGLEQQLSIHYRLGSRAFRTFVLAQGGDDFTDEQVALATRIQPLLSLLARHSAAAGRAGGDVHAALTVRERAVLRLLIDGLTAQSIADRLGVSPRTVHRHLGNLYRKLDVKDRLQAALLAHRLGLCAGPAEDDGPRPGVGVRFRASWDDL